MNKFAKMLEEKCESVTDIALVDQKKKQKTEKEAKEIKRNKVKKTRKIMLKEKELSIPRSISMKGSLYEKLVTETERLGATSVSATVGEILAAYFEEEQSNDAR